MRLDHLLSKEEEVRLVKLSIVELSMKVEKINRKFLVARRLGETPVHIPNTMVKTCPADGTILETVWESRWLPDL